MRYFGIQLNGTRASKVLFNFSQAENLRINGIGIEGSVPAPKAQVNFDNGNIRGTLVAESFCGTGEIRYVPPEIRAPPECMPPLEPPECPSNPPECSPEPSVCEKPPGCPAPPEPPVCTPAPMAKDSLGGFVGWDTYSDYGDPTSPVDVTVTPSGRTANGTVNFATKTGADGRYPFDDVPRASTPFPSRWPMATMRENRSSEITAAT